MSDNALKILLVEDNPGDARLVSAMLPNGEQGFQITTAKRLDEAIDLMTKQQFDAVLLDLTLPDSTGFETIDTARSSNGRNGETPIIVVTGRYSEEDSLSTMKHGAQDFLLKNNLRAEALIRSIRFAIERQRVQVQKAGEDIERRQAQELASLEQMRAPPTSMATARAYGFERLSDASPDTFEMLVDQYCEIVEQAMEELGFRVDRKATQQAMVLAQRLGFLRATPRDVVDLHIKALGRFRSTKATKSFVIAEEARMLLLELMGHLASYYRDHMLPASRLRPGDDRATRNNKGQGPS